MDLAEGDEADGVEAVLAGDLGKVDDGAGQVVDDQHGLVALEVRGKGGEREREDFNADVKDKIS